MSRRSLFIVADNMGQFCKERDRLSDIYWSPKIWIDSVEKLIESIIKYGKCQVFIEGFENVELVRDAARKCR